MEKEFVIRWVERLSSKELKTFPEKFFQGDFDEVPLPQKYLVLGPELFGSYELLDTDKKPAFRAIDINYAKFVLYANRTKPNKVLIPKNYNTIVDAIKEYEKHLDSIVRLIYEDYKAVFPKSNNQVEIANQIFSLLDLRRYY
jgi:hypothetical protein